MSLSKKEFLFVSSCILVICTLPELQALAVNVRGSVGGEDHSGQVKVVQNLLTTLEGMAYNWVAPLLGGFLVISGIWKIANRDFATGVLSTTSGGALFFARKIADALAGMGGT